MSSLRIVIGIICLVVALVARGIWAETRIPPPAQSIIKGPSTTAVYDRGDVDEPYPPGRIESSRMDRYGNQIESAVGDYRIDRRGEMYERHSPDTAVPRLGVPSA
jgi:hypothetical protein